VLTPDNPNQPAVVRTLSQLRPDFLFSFYYRRLLDESILRTARQAALNMHGSLLPRYRGRAPVNWAVLNGEPETGATLHHMVARADAGDIVDQLAVPILEDDDARAVMAKVTTAAETILKRSLPALAAGTAPRRAQNLAEGEYCGRRSWEDGRIDWGASAERVHNLVRALAPPYPGAFTDVRGERLFVHRTRRLAGAADPDRRPRLCAQGGRACQLICSDGHALELLAAADGAGPVDLEDLASTLAGTPVLF
jgi:methionyl-tRNA formyltransferase